MDKTTAGALLAIMNNHGTFESLSAGADDRVKVYLHALELLPEMVREVRDHLQVVSPLTEASMWEDLRRLSSDLGDAAELARLLDSVQVASGVWDE